MSDCVRELEQLVECGCLEFELEQCPEQLEHERRVPLRLQCLKPFKGKVELQGYVFPALCEINRCCFFSRSRGSKIRHATISKKRGGFLRRFGNLFEHVFSMENLYQAYIDTRAGKRQTAACFKFETNLGKNLAVIHDNLHAGTYRIKPYKLFRVHEPKERLIHAPAFKDTVVQRAIYRVIFPVFDRSFIDTSFACRKGKGTHRASHYTQQAMRKYNREMYTLKLDVKKFFHSINRDILKKLIERKIKDTRLIEVMMMFSSTDHPTGMPIGNLLSQMYALVYLNPMDHFIKRDLKIKHYVRYMDDFILIGLMRPDCLEYRAQITDFLARQLDLELSKTTIQKIKKGVNFVGYRTWQSRKFIRKHSLYKFRRAAKNNQREKIVSLMGHAKNTNTLPYMMKTIKEVKSDFKIPKSYSDICRREQIAC